MTMISRLSSTILLLATPSSTPYVSASSSSTVAVGERPKRPKGYQNKRNIEGVVLNKLKASSNNNNGSGLNKLKAGATTSGSSAFNPNLVEFDPNSSKYKHDVAHGGTSGTDEEAYNPCPPDPSFSGNRASFDCSSYIYCIGGAPQGGYSTCNGLKFNNDVGSCQWGERVVCDSDSSATSSSSIEMDAEASQTSEEGGGGGGTSSIPIGSTTEISVSTSNSAGSAGASYSDGGGGDWGGKWVNSVWVSDSEVSDNSLAWLDTQWADYDIVTYPAYPILPLHTLNVATNATTVEPSSISLPSSYISKEGWSSTTRSKKKVTGYYASWQVLDNAERASPTNIQFNKVDRVNYAFFQCDEGGNVWGMDSWSDPVVLFGPHDWSVSVPEHAGHYPQFYDNNGFDDNSGSEWNYVGSQYLPLGQGVYCHRTTPTGKRDCNGHRGKDGLIGRAHEHGAEVYVSIGGWSKSSVFPAMARNARSRRNFAQHCAGLLREYNFDGIDLAWQFPGYTPNSGTADDGANFVLLLKDIRSALDAYTNVTYPNGERSFGLTAALPCYPSIINIQDVSQVSEILSELNLLSIDFHGTWSDVTGHNAPLFDGQNSALPEYSANGCVERWVRGGASKSKINLALPFYGRSYGDAKGLNQGYNGADLLHFWADEGKPQYYNIIDQLPDMISLRDDVTKTQFAWFESGGFLSFDDSQAICDKIEYGLEHDLHGYTIWELSGDLTDNFNTPLLDTVNFKLDKGDVFDCESFRLETRDENGDVVSLKPAEPNPWYVKTWESGTCVNDGKQPEWASEENLFRRKEECCAHKFEYRMDDCIGPPTPPPTGSPSLEPTKSPLVTDKPTDEPSHTFGAALLAGVADSPSPVAREAEEDKKDPSPPVTWCLGGCKGENEKCVGNQNNPQSIQDSDCKPCQSGQDYWPCNTEGLCFCWDTTLARIPPAPASGLAQLSDERPCDYFTEDIFNALADNAAEHPYTYEGLCDAIDNYNEVHVEKIFMMGTEEERKSEFASFLGHTLHESDEWKAPREYLMCADHQVVDGKTYCKPCDSGSFNWETFKCDGAGLVGDGLTFNGYCDFTIEPPAACPCDGALVSEPAPLEGYIPASKVFFGRGAIQLSWNYNYRAASEALTGESTTFCDDPDLVATTPEYAWGAGVFFWMENLKEETTCHIEALKYHDFGGTLNNINGGLECPAFHGGWHGEAIKLRLNRYCKASSALGVESILTLDGCKGLNTSFAECLGDGTCPDCQRYSDGIDPIVLQIAETTHSEHEHATTPVDTTLDELEATPLEPAATPESTPSPVEVVADAQVEEEEESVVVEATKEEDMVQLDASTTSCPEDLKPVEGFPGCCVTEPAYHGDGACDPDWPFNTAVCAFDGGDCCKETCDLDSHYGCSAETSEFGPFGFYCVNPSLTEEHIDSTACTVSDRTRIGDGRCDAGVEMYNSEACNWDGGDCCAETCNQLYAHYNCGDSAFPYDCKNPVIVPDTLPPSSPPVRLATSPPTTSPVAVKALAGSQALSGASSFAAGSVSTQTEPTQMTEPSVSMQSENTKTSLVTVIASDDATIIKGFPDTNHGGDVPILKVKGMPNGPNAHDVIMRFIIPALTPITAQLRIYSLLNSNSGGIVYVAPEINSWSETDVTWNSAPHWETRIGNVGEVEAEHWYTMDVSDIVSSLNGSEGAITIRIRSRDPQVVEYSSREGRHPPEIMISYTGEEMAAFTADASMETPATTPATTTSTEATSSVSSPEQILGVHVLSPSDDATILAEHPDENYGQDASLQVDNDSGVYEALIKFDVSGLETSSISSAILRLYCVDGSDAGGIFGKTATSNWDESSVTWSSAPAAYGLPIQTLGPVEKAKWYEIDVTNLFSGGSMDAVSLRITSSSWNRAGYSSKEGSEPPQLVIKGAGEVMSHGMESNVSEAEEMDNSSQVIVTGTGIFYPVWGGSGESFCRDGTSPPSWASGAYLKSSKSDCCNTFFSLDVDECLES